MWPSPRLARGVGIGLDAGEAVPVGTGYRGGALNVAARLCALAAPGEVLASEGVMHLARKVEGIRYLQGRLERLKGIDHPVRVVEVVPHQRGDALVRRLRRRTQGRRWVPLAGAAAIVAGVAILLSVALGGGKTASSFRPGVVLLDIKSRHQVGFISPSEIARPAFPVFAGGHIWVMNFTPSSYVEIDPATGKVLTQFAPPSGSTDTTTYQPYAVDGNSLWTGSGHDLVRMDTDLGKEVDRFHLDKLVGDSGTVEGVALGDGLVWVSRDVGIGQIVAFDRDGKAPTPVRRRRASHGHRLRRRTPVGSRLRRALPDRPQHEHRHPGGGHHVDQPVRRDRRRVRMDERPRQRRRLQGRPERTDRSHVSHRPRREQPKLQRRRALGLEH